MTVDDLLRHTLTDEHLDLPVPAGLLTDVRRRHRRRRVTTASAAVAVTAAAIAAVSLTAGSSPRATLSTFASDGVPAGSAAPGISPDFVPSSGRDWLLTRDALSSFNASHTVPKDELVGDPKQVPSPAPVTSGTDELRAYANGAGLPEGCTFTTDEAYDGDSRVSVLHITLPDGRPVWLQRQRLAKPVDVSPGDDVNQSVASGIDDITGTTAALASYQDFNFGFGERWNATGNAHAVNVVTAGGIQWFWIAPHPVPVSLLRTWAVAAAQHDS